jgi:hypothetical protein
MYLFRGTKMNEEREMRRGRGQGREERGKGARQEILEDDQGG